MRFNIRVQAITGEEGGEGGWEVRVTDLATGLPVLRPGTDEPFVRTLRRVGEDLNVFPQPPEEEAGAIPDDPTRHPHRELCTTTDARLLRNTFRGIIERKSADMVKFGRYLFATLLGDELWDLLNGMAPREPLELALSWGGGDAFINRLPWEMMHGPETFLAQEPEVAITRRVASAAAAVSEITAARVLFVIGSELGADEIKPGAEYLGLLRSLKNDEGLRLKSHLLLRATPQRIRAAVEWFEPTVIHFICHGQANERGEIFLKLMKDDNSGRPELVSAEALFGLLRPRPDAPLPQIVVLNACYTASKNPDAFLKAGQAASPMAVRLVEGDARGGVPIVVGMAGQVSDHACRLFTRSFYLSLLRGGEIAQASAAGRRVGIIQEGLIDPKKSVDWAMPTLFLAEGVSEPKLRINPPQVERDWHVIASDFAPPKFPAFCDRMEIFDLYDQMMSNYDALIADGRGLAQYDVSEVKAISVFVSKKDKTNEGKHGRTWLLHELAARAVLDGHVPCLVNGEWVKHNPDERYPQTFARLIHDLVWAIGETATRFQFPNYSLAECLDLLGEVRDGRAPAERLPRDVQAVYKKARSYTHPAVVSAAARIDLLRLLAKARLQRPEGERSRCKLLLLIDDVHQMDAAASDLLNHLLGTDGLRSPSAEDEDSPNALADVRVVFTHDATLGLGKEEEIKSWVDRHRWVKAYPLKIFQQPTEERLAYQYFLSGWYDGGDEAPLTVCPSAQTDFTESFFQQLSVNIAGVPSRLDSPTTTAVIKTFLALPVKVLQKADDDALLELVQQHRRGR